ncbi:FAD-dependent oxidoreductase [Terriglobus tenax]|nr:FAD-dependent oxidoreductase [Terriglobus tenax]
MRRCEPSAARELQHLKRSVLVLESNDRIGGRRAA